MADAKRPTLDVEERPERGTRATKRLRREGFVPGVVYGGTDGDCHLLQGRTRARSAHVLVDGSALIDLKVGGKTPPGDRQGPAARTPSATSCIHIDLLEVRLDEKIQTQVDVARSRAPRRRPASRRAACSSR